MSITENLKLEHVSPQKPTLSKSKHLKLWKTLGFSDEAIEVLIDEANGITTHGLVYLDGSNINKLNLKIKDKLLLQQVKVNASRLTAEPPKLPNAIPKWSGKDSDFPLWIEEINLKIRTDTKRLPTQWKPVVKAGLSVEQIRILDKYEFEFMEWSDAKVQLQKLLCSQTSIFASRAKISVMVPEKETVNAYCIRFKSAVQLAQLFDEEEATFLFMKSIKHQGLGTRLQDYFLFNNKKPSLNDAFKVLKTLVQDDPEMVLNNKTKRTFESDEEELRRKERKTNRRKKKSKSKKEKKNLVCTRCDRKGHEKPFCFANKKEDGTVLMDTPPGRRNQEVETRNPREITTERGIFSIQLLVNPEFEEEKEIDEISETETALSIFLYSRKQTTK
jgi:hypothetical protein